MQIRDARSAEPPAAGGNDKQTRRDHPKPGAHGMKKLDVRCIDVGIDAARRGRDGHQVVERKRHGNAQGKRRKGERARAIARGGKRASSHDTFWAWLLALAEIPPDCVISVTKYANRMTTAGYLVDIAIPASIIADVPVVVARVCVEPRQKGER